MPQPLSLQARCHFGKKASLKRVPVNLNAESACLDKDYPRWNTKPFIPDLFYRPSGHGSPELQ